eukprot:73487-Chlamydomonas_euryale.AAC.1
MRDKRRRGGMGAEELKKCAAGAGGPGARQGRGGGRGKENVELAARLELTAGSCHPSMQPLRTLSLLRALLVHTRVREECLEH